MDAINYSASQRAVCHEFGVEFYNSLAWSLIASSLRGEDTKSQCFHDLEAIMQHAGNLSSRLWRWRTALGVMSLGDLNEPFVARSELLKTHPLQRLYQDDDQYDGWVVSVVMHPAVLGFGSGDGRTVALVAFG
jgi:hypothetical protein